MPTPAITTARVLLFSLILGFAQLASSAALAGSIICPPPDTGYHATQVFTRFYPYRFGTKGVDLTYRDIEVEWDTLYGGGLSDNVNPDYS